MTFPTTCRSIPSVDRRKYPDYVHKFPAMAQGRRLDVLVFDAVAYLDQPANDEWSKHTEICQLLQLTLR
jgi:hypothetical protein